MRLLIIMFITFNIIFSQVISKISIKETLGITENILMNPYKIYLLRDIICVEDPGADYKINCFDLTGNQTNSFGIEGQGPEELDQLNYFVGNYNKTIFVYGMLSGRVLIYDLINKRGKGNINIINSFGISPFLFNNYLLERKMFSDFFLSGKKVSKNYSLVEDDIKIGEINNNYKECKKNPMLLAGSYFNYQDETIYISFINSSVLLGYNLKGDNIFESIEPDNILFPSTNSLKNDMSFHSPARNRYPEVNIAITGDKKYIYTLFSGTILRSKKDLLLNSGDLGQGEILNIYNRKTSEFLGSYKLPYPMRDIVATESCIYGLSVDPEVAIYKLKKPLD